MSNLSNQCSNCHHEEVCKHTDEMKEMKSNLLKLKTKMNSLFSVSILCPHFKRVRTNRAEDISGLL